ncbi:MAG: DUF692 family protein [Deltaproteobacteria bacterium]|nr:MAG: DUF692 family protein [Deltaproteobacteria bacterium]
MDFSKRVEALPRLGVGVSTEYGAAAAVGALDVAGLRARYPEYAGFLELGVEVDKGLDDDARRWIASGAPVTYHFLDINLDEPEDFDPAWLDAVRALVAEASPAWLCGDAGLWHFGPRERGHMLLLPPVLTDDSASALAEGIVRLREATGREVIPENPPGSAWVGDLHLLDFFARVCERADTGMLLDTAHLAIYQQACGHAPLTGLDGFPCDRIVEMHVAGGRERHHEGFPWIEDDHDVTVLPATWEIFERAAARADHLKAVVFECERNTLEATLPGFARIAEILERADGARRAS